MSDDKRKGTDKKAKEQEKHLHEQHEDHQRLFKENKQLAAELEELTSDMQRLQAEFENHKKHLEKDTQRHIEYANADFAKKLLPVLDSFDLAFKNTEKHEQFLKGMELVYSQFKAALKEAGLQEIKSVGEKLDPYKHEVMMREDSDKEEGVILEEFQKGFVFKDRVLRHSMVKVSGK